MSTERALLPVLVSLDTAHFVGIGLSFHVLFSPLQILASTCFLSLWDLASTGFLIGFSVFCTDYGQYWFSNFLRISRVLVFL